MPSDLFRSRPNGSITLCVEKHIARADVIMSQSESFQGGSDITQLLHPTVDILRIESLRNFQDLPAILLIALLVFVEKHCEISARGKL
ncbi:hypothetical protein KCU67_g115, partial [Aureobasidium melanogenum]